MESADADFVKHGGRLGVMTFEQAKTLVGKLVLSKDSGHKLTKSARYWHGPYKLLQVTKEGLAILEGREEFRIALNLIMEFDPDGTIRPWAYESSVALINALSQ